MTPIEWQLVGGFTGLGLGLVLLLLVYWLCDWR